VYGYRVMYLTSYIYSFSFPLGIFILVGNSFLQHSQVTYVEYAALPSLAESDAELNALCLAKRQSAKAIHCEDGVECLAAP
jgi:hypothetical protein